MDDRSHLAFPIRKSRMNPRTNARLQSRNSAAHQNVRNPGRLVRAIVRKTRSTLSQRKLARRATQIVPSLIERLRQQPALVVLTYHNVTCSNSQEPAYLTMGNRIDAQLLHQQLTWIAAHFPFVRLKDGVEAWTNGTLASTVVAVTFDDAMKSIETHVPQILRPLNIPATIFVNAAFLDNRDTSWVKKVAYLEQNGYEDALQEIFERKKPQEGWARHLRNHLTRDDITRLDALDRVFRNLHGELIGVHLSFKYLQDHETKEIFDVGNHSLRHHRFSSMPRTLQRESIMENQRQLAVLPNYVNLFAVPFGRRKDWNSETIAVSEELHHRLVTLENGINKLGRHTVDVQRIGCEVVSLHAFQLRLWEALCK